MAIEAFERLHAGPGIALLRVIARTEPAVSLDGGVKLIVYDRNEVRRIEPLPAPADPPGLIRVAYSVPVRRLGSRAAMFALELPDAQVVDLPTPVERHRPDDVDDAARYRWLLRARMAERGMFRSTDLAEQLAKRGQALSGTQVYRLVTGRPQRLKLELLAALCDILHCTPNDLIECGAPRTVKGAGRGGDRRR